MAVPRFASPSRVFLELANGNRRSLSKCISSTANMARGADPRASPSCLTWRFRRRGRPLRAPSGKGRRFADAFRRTCNLFSQDFLLAESGRSRRPRARRLLLAADATPRSSPSAWAIGAPRAAGFNVARGAWPRASPACLACRFWCRGCPLSTPLGKERRFADAIWCTWSLFARVTSCLLEGAQRRQLRPADRRGRGVDAVTRRVGSSKARRAPGATWRAERVLVPRRHA